MTSAHVIGELIWSETEDVNGTRGVLFEWERLHNEVMTTLEGYSCRQLDVHELVHFAVVYLEKIRVRLLANLALKSLPKHADKIFRLFSLEFS
jgi:hypothetical protein